jgi:hypothetical protein
VKRFISGLLAASVATVAWLCRYAAIAKAYALPPCGIDIGFFVGGDTSMAKAVVGAGNGTAADPRAHQARFREQ